MLWRYKKLIVILYIVFTIQFTTYSTEVKKSFSALTFNVENLFDDKDDGTEYSSFKSPQWGSVEYQKKIVAVGSALQKTAIDVDIIALQEIENERVAKDLQKYYLPKLPHVVVSNDSYSAVEVGLLSAHKIISVNSHDISINNVTKTLRPILDVKLDVKLGVVPSTAHFILQVLVVHLKSRRTSKGTYSSEEIRSFQYKLLSTVIDESMPTIILGDFNDYTPDRNMFLKDKNLLETKISVQPDTEIEKSELVSGTYYYKSKWIQLDHVLYDVVASKIFTNARTTILAFHPFINEYGYPNRSFRSQIGVSDHLPILFEAEILK